MATLIQKWRASDGSEWNSQAAADERDSIMAQVSEAMRPLGERDSRMMNGDGFIQHDEASVIRAKLAIHAIAKAGPLKWWIDEQIMKHGKTDKFLALDIHPGWQGRMLDGGCEPLERAYRRFCCIDASNREWQQPYYAANPGTGKQLCLNG